MTLCLLFVGCDKAARGLEASASRVQLPHGWWRCLEHGDVNGISSGTGTVKKVGDKRRGEEDVTECKQKIAVVNRRV